MSLTIVLYNPYLSIKSGIYPKARIAEGIERRKNLRETITPINSTKRKGDPNFNVWSNSNGVIPMAMVALASV